MAIAPGPGELQGMLACVVTQHFTVYLTALIDQLTNLTWFPGSELVVDIKAKTKTSTPFGSHGPGPLS